MKTRFLIIIFLLLLLSCEKHQDRDTNNPDIISHYVFSPEIFLTPTKSYKDVPHVCPNVPVPTDSIAHFELDINNDSINDFIFEVERWTYYGGSSFQGNCLPWQNFKTTITPLTKGNQICAKSQEGINTYAIAPIEFAVGEKISIHSNNWENGCTLFRNSMEYRGSYSPTSNQYYCGVRIKVSGNIYYGWILLNVKQNILTIQSFAINLSSNQSIQAGQQ